MQTLVLKNTDKDKLWQQDIIAWKQPVWFASNFATPFDKQGFWSKARTNQTKSAFKDAMHQPIKQNTWYRDLVAGYIFIWIFVEKF